MKIQNDRSSVSILRIAFISILSVSIFAIILVAIFFSAVNIFNWKISFGTHVIRQGGTPNISILKTEKQKEDESFNNTQWEIYYQSWLQTKNNLSSIKECKEDFDLLKEKYSYAKADFEKARLEDKYTREINFNYALHGRAGNIADELDHLMNMYDLSADKPDFIPEIYIGDTYEDQTKETAKIRLDQILTDFNNINNLARTIQCHNVNNISFDNYENSCWDMGDLFFEMMDVSQPIYIEDGDKIEELDIRRNQREEEKKIWINDCFEL